MDRPNPIRILKDVVKVIRSTRPPNPTGTGTVEHEMFIPVLDALSNSGLAGAGLLGAEIDAYVGKLQSIDPDYLSHEEALAYWINLYNAAAIDLAIEAQNVGAPSVLRISGAFKRPVAHVAGEELSLAAIEHAKIRRFGDPRIHGALVCGSLSCPTLRPEPFTGGTLDAQLEDQMSRFIDSGGVTRGDDGTLELSRIFLWYGPDFVRPHRMPSFVPVGRRRTVRALSPWLPDGADKGKIQFQDYDWGLACAVG